MGRQTALIELKLKYANQALTKTLSDTVRGKALSKGYQDQVLDFSAYPDSVSNVWREVTGSYNSQFWVFIPSGRMDLELDLDGFLDPLSFSGITTPVILPFRILTYRAKMTSYLDEGQLYVLRGDDIAPALQTLTLTGYSFGTNTPVGTVIGNIIGSLENSSFSISDARLAIQGTSVVVATAIGAPEVLTVNLVETNVAASNSPKTTILTITVEAGTYFRYWGESANTTLTPTEVQTLLQHDLDNTLDTTVIYDCRGGKYPYYVVPASFGPPSQVLVNSMLFTAYTTSDITLNVNGSNVAYKMYRFNYIQTGYPIEVQWIS